MSKVNLEGSEIRIKFKNEIDSTYGTGNFTKVQAKEAADKAGLNETEFKSICTHVLRFFKVEKDVYSFSSPTETVVASEKKIKNTIKKDFDIINSDPVVAPIKKKDTAMEMKVKSSKPMVVSLIPKKDPTYITWGHFKDIKSILERKIFYPIFITGLSGNGKTSMVREVCAKLKRDLVRVNITVETDEDDLLGGFRLVNGETVWQDGPLVVAMKTGSVALIDEVDLASH